MNLKNYKEGDRISTTKWEQSFKVVLANYRGFTVAVQNRGYYVQQLVINTHDNSVGIISEKGLVKKEVLQLFVDDLYNHKRELDRRSVYPASMIIKEERNEEQ